MALLPELDLADRAANAFNERRP